ncbi:MAG: hypothetical protein C5B50_22630 [Verrucomicrobia bacterium]|nr:MAG: hypothetical protein C5B50_22630 [Verrucomicrobiota bacterium]
MPHKQATLDLLDFTHSPSEHVLARCAHDMFCKERDYPLIALNALAGFSEDKLAARRFTYRFLPWSLSCLVAFLGFGASIVIPLMRKQYDPVPNVYVLTAAASFVLCVGFFVATWRRMVAAVPISPRSGQPMEVYRLEDVLKDKKYELAYICRKSRTYFRVVFKAPGD